MFQQWLENLKLDAIRPEILVGVIVFVVVMFIGAMILAIYEHRRKAVTRKLEPSNLQGAPRPAFRESRFLRFIEQVGNYVSHGRASTNLWEQLIRAGYMNRAARPSTPASKCSCWSRGSRSGWSSSFRGRSADRGRL